VADSGRREVALRGSDGVRGAFDTLQGACNSTLVDHADCSHTDHIGAWGRSGTAHDLISCTSVLAQHAAPDGSLCR